MDGWVKPGHDENRRDMAQVAADSSRSILIRRSRLLDAVQPTLFRDDELPQRPLHDPDAARGRLTDMLAKMRAAASWPWKDATVRHYREAVWPSLLDRLPDADEAERLRAEFDTESARLDAA
jgi:hypothetical protein